MHTLISARYDCDFAPRKLTSIVVRKLSDISTEKKNYI